MKILNNSISKFSSTYIGLERLLDFPETSRSELLFQTVENFDGYTLKVLLSGAGERITDRNQAGQTPLHLAVERNNVEAVRLILAADCSRYALGGRNRDNETPLMLAVRTQNITIVTMLIHPAADIDAQDNFGDTAIMLAVRARNEHAISKLIESNANLEVENNDGDTALMIAALTNNITGAILLLGGRADVMHSNFKRSNKILILDNHNAIEDKYAEPYIALHCAASEGHIGVIAALSKYWLNACQRTNVELKKYLYLLDTTLFAAAAHNQIGVIHSLIDQGVRPNCATRLNSTPLMAASKNGAAEAAGYLLARSASIHTKNRQGWSALTLAARGNHRSVLDLISPCTKPNQRSAAISEALITLAENGEPEGFNCLLSSCGAGPAEQLRYIAGVVNACQAPHFYAVETLLDAGVRADSPEMIALFGRAAAANHVDTLALLIAAESHCLDQYLDVVINAMHDIGDFRSSLVVLNVLLESGATANKDALIRLLTMAAEVGLGDNAALEAFERLKRAGADVNVGLFSAVSKSWTGAISQLISDTADVNARDASRFTPLMVAAASGNLAAMEILLNCNANVHARADLMNGAVNALMLAAREGHVAAVNMLLSYGAIADEIDSLGFTAVRTAVKHLQLLTVEALLDSGALVNTTLHGMTLLMHALTDGSSESALDTLWVGAARREMGLLLCARGADPDAVNADGLTALMLAAQEKKYSSMDALCELRADLNVRDSEGNTALMRSVLAGDCHAVRLLTSWNADTKICNYFGENALTICRQHEGPEDRSELKSILLAAGARDPIPVMEKIGI